MPKISKGRRIGRDLVAAMREALDHAEGRARLPERTVVVSDVTAARQAMRLTQVEFSRMLNIPLPTVRKWERGAEPSGAAATLLKIIRKDPEAVRAALSSPD